MTTGNSVVTKAARKTKTTFPNNARPASMLALAQPALPRQVSQQRSPLTPLVRPNPGRTSPWHSESRSLARARRAQCPTRPCQSVARHIAAGHQDIQGCFTPPLPFPKNLPTARFDWSASESAVTLSMTQSRQPVPRQNRLVLLIQPQHQREDHNADNATPLIHAIIEPSEE